MSVHEQHRDIQGGTARAAVFGVSDGLVSNVSLILGVAGANAGPGVVRVAGLAGLVAGAVSMAAGEYVSMQAQKELLERELAVERQALEESPEEELAELAATYEQRGLSPDAARTVAEQVMTDPEVALEVHAREELGIDPTSLGSPIGAMASSFLSFCVGAIIPLLPWLFFGGDGATLTSIGLALVAAAIVGAVLAGFTGKSRLFSAARQIAIAAIAAGATYVIGSVVGTTL